MKLVVFDLDGVLVDINSSWQFIHRYFGKDNQDNFNRYLHGKITYREFMKSDIALWGRINVKQIKTILNKVSLIEAAPIVIAELKKSGIITAIISSGISILADRVKEYLKIDYSYANKLLINEKGWLTGEGEEKVALLNKGLVLKMLAEKEEISLKQCAVIGDSKFDIPLFRMAGLSIAINPKDKATRRAADLIINDKDLAKVLPWVKSKNLKKVSSSLNYNDVKEARSVADSLLPDNLRVPSGLYVRTWSEGKTVKIKIICTRRIESVLATFNDLFTCAQVAERAIKAVQIE